MLLSQIKKLYHDLSATEIISFMIKLNVESHMEGLWCEMALHCLLTFLVVNNATVPCKRGVWGWD